MLVKIIFSVVMMLFGLILLIFNKKLSITQAEIYEAGMKPKNAKILKSKKFIIFFRIGHILVGIVALIVGFRGLIDLFI